MLETFAICRASQTQATQRLDGRTHPAPAAMVTAPPVEPLPVPEPATVTTSPPSAADKGDEPVSNREEWRAPSSSDTAQCM